MTLWQRLKVVVAGGFPREGQGGAVSGFRAGAPASGTSGFRPLGAGSLGVFGWGCGRWVAGFAVALAFGASVSAQQAVTLAWNANPEPDVAGYRIYYGTPVGNFLKVVTVGKVTSCVVTGLESGVTYGFYATCFNTTGLESLPSETVTYTTPVSGGSPTVALASPIDGASFLAPARLDLVADVTGNGLGVVRVNFYSGSTLLKQDTEAPYAFTWEGVGVGAYTLSARVIFSDGSVMATPRSTVMVGDSVEPDPGAVAPSVVLSSPAEGSSYTAPATMNLGASVDGKGRGVVRVNFYAGSTLLRQDTAAPYSFAWEDVEAGSYSLSARAVFDDGTVVSSPRLDVVVTDASPSVALTSPKAGAAFTAPATVSLAASVTANGQSISKVRFYRGSTLIGEDASSPYSFLWSNVAGGTYSLTARAVYGSGSIVTSPAVSVVVSSLPEPWRTVNIGSVTAAGSASESGGAYTVSGAGNLGVSADNFRFVYQTLSGDGQIKAQVRSLNNLGADGEVGVMIRGSLTSGSAYAFMGIAGDGAWWRQQRESTGGSSTISVVSSQAEVGLPPDTWVRLVRSGSTVGRYVSTDGVNWAFVSATSMSLGTTAYIGFAVASGSSSSASTVTFDNVTVVP